MKFSILMSVYEADNPKYLDDCFHSLRDQTLIASEIILVEDGKISQKLKSVIEEYREELNIISIKLAENSGLAVALNKGLKYCNYELIARMDSDDIALPERFKKQVHYMNTCPEISASSGVIKEFNEKNKVISTRLLPVEHDEIVIFSKKRSPLSHPAVMFRRSVIDAVGGYPLFRNAQDYALWSVLITKGYRLGNLPDVLVMMRTGVDLLKRRNFLYFKQEFMLLLFQKKIGFLTFRQFVFNIMSRFLLRSSPNFLKSFFYKILR